MDVYPASPGEMTLWIIGENGERLQFTDKFKPRMYVSGRKKDLEELANHFFAGSPVEDWRFRKKKCGIMSSHPSNVLELDLKYFRQTIPLARKLLRKGNYRRYRLYNVDIPPEQIYLYRKNLFPFAFIGVNGKNRDLKFSLFNSPIDLQYHLPQLRKMWIQVETESTGKLDNFRDPVEKIVVSYQGGERVIGEGDETQKLSELVQIVQEADPDLIFTHKGDSYLFPYLAYRGLKNQLLNTLILGRDDVPLEVNKERGISFFSYGRTYYKAPLHRLQGRIHIDVDNSFIYPHCGLSGLIEVSRTCRVPLHQAARASIGTIMSSSQLYQAFKEDILVPWKKRETESFKSAWELLVADRGGFVFEPRIGLHQYVAEIDFSSMYPTLMVTRNISGETVLCECCPDSELRVPELNYHICQKRKGIVPQVLITILQKRQRYKQLRDQSRSKKLKAIYDQRQNALKWILVTCFGYLGYRNAKFGRVDAHIAVCAFARDVLLKAVRIAENYGFEVVHGIVDSLWITKEKNTLKDCKALCKEISQATKVPINLKGLYKWIVFLPSKNHPQVPVLNKYYGVYQTGQVKVRGIAARKRDTPSFIREAQLNMIQVLSEASNPREVKDKIQDSLEILQSYAEKLMTRKVSNHQLLIAKRLSKPTERYNHLVPQVVAARQLKKAGATIHPGETIRYLITNADHKKPQHRVKAAELTTKRTPYDVNKYLALLFTAAAEILRPFGYTDQKLKNRILYQEQQHTVY